LFHFKHQKLVLIRCSFKIAVQASDEQKEIAVQCNIAGLPPLALLRSSEPMVSDESDNENICDEPYSPSTSDLDEEAAMEDGAVSNSETEMKSEG